MKTLPLKDCLSTLPVGYVHKPQEGDQEPIIYREFELGPITGRVRLALGDDKVRTNLGRQTSELLARTLKHIGEIKGIDAAFVRKLSHIDREFLGWVHFINRMGKRPMVVTQACPECKTEFEVDIDKGMLLVNVLEDTDYEWFEGQRVFVFSDEEYGTMRVRLLTGHDEERLSPYVERNPEEGGMRTIFNAIYTWNDEKPTFDQFLDLPEAVLEWVAACMNSLDIGSSQVVNMECPSCYKEFRETISPLALLGDLEAKKVLPPYARK